MKKILFAVLIIFLYFLFFILKIQFQKAPESILPPVKEQKSAKPENVHVKKSVSRKYPAKETKTKKHRVKISKAEKVFYPSYFKSGKITLFLNNPTLYDMPSTSARAKSCKLIINELRNVRKSFYFSMYELGEQRDFINAILYAKAKGIDILGVADSGGEEKNYTPFSKIEDKANITYDKNKIFMHNKFFINDEASVITGSMNMTISDCSGYNQNALVLIEDEKAAAVYKKEFDQMHGGKFKNEKEDFSVSDIQIDENTKIGIYFSPVNDVFYNLIAPQIRSAKKNIRVSAFVLTHNGIITGLIKAKQRGVEVKVILDALSANNFREKVKKMREAGIFVKIENFSGKDHEKIITIDDESMIIGSANFSYSGFKKNDENVVCIKNKDITRFYNAYFDLLYDALDNALLFQYPHAEGLDSGNSCFDGLDNDFDGKIDKDDEGCRLNPS